MNSLLVICFSKDRPLQLEAYVRSLYENKGDTKIELYVIYKASSEEFEKAYYNVGSIMAGLSNKEGQIYQGLIEETRIKEQLKVLITISDRSPTRSVGGAAHEYVMFGCDDVVFKDKIGPEVFESFTSMVFGFSMRLGKNITYCHPADQAEKLQSPQVVEHAGHDNVLVWDWTREPGVDFRYPFELNSTIYRRSDVLKYLNLVDGLETWHPNILEGNFYRPEIIMQFRDRQLMASYEYSRAYTVTVNRVQDIALNRVYDEMSTESLLAAYNSGVRLDLNFYKERRWNSIHIGDLKLKPKYHIDQFTKGWFIGDFDPSIISTTEYEVAVKYYNAGDAEGRHVHKVAKEITMIARGRVMMSGVIYEKGSIIVTEPGQSTDFRALEDTITVVVKQPSVKGDKYDVTGDRV